MVYRRAGDDNLLVEYGPLVLDLELRLRVHVLMARLERTRSPGIIDLTPGIRSLQIHYDAGVCCAGRLLDVCCRPRKPLCRRSTISRSPPHRASAAVAGTTRRPQLAIAQVHGVGAARRALVPDQHRVHPADQRARQIEEVSDIVFDASYLVLGLGDVYLGAPVATPIDPRHRLVTTKYNPARTWTPENAVGIGGAYLCVYGMEGPGGYQFFGRTSQMWNTCRSTADFEPGKPWLLRFFDQIRFYPVSGAELLGVPRRFPARPGPLKIEETFRLRDYRIPRRQRRGIEAAKARQQAAFEAERAAGRQRARASM